MPTETALAMNNLDRVVEENRRLKARFEAENEQLRSSLALLAAELRALQQRVDVVSKPSVAVTTLSSSTAAATERHVSTNDTWTQTSPLEAREVACQHYDSDVFSPRNGSVQSPPPTSERRPPLVASPLSDATTASKSAADVPSLAREADRLLSVISRLRSDRVAQRIDRSGGE